MDSVFGDKMTIQQVTEELILSSVQGLAVLMIGN